MTKTRLIALFSVICLVTVQAQELTRVEPPFWWAGMQSQELQLLIYGDDISLLTPTIEDDNVEVVAVHIADNPNYLFVDLRLSPELQPCSVEISFKKKRRTKISYTYTFKQRDTSSRQTITPADVVYLITPDRYANGDPSNDVIPGLQEGLARDKEYGRHGGDIAGIVDHLDYIQDVGFTAIWLNPILINDQHEWSYHGYATTDYYQVDPRFGTNASYVAMAKDLADRNMGMIMDIIVNHCGSHHWWMKDLPFDNWLNNQGQEYLGTNHRKETLLDPYASAIDRQIMTDGWFVPAMPDLNQRNPFMSKYLIQNSIWWIEYAHLSGIRQDTYSYPYKEFMTDWTCAIRAEYPDFYIVGEEWIDDTSVISY